MPRDRLKICLAGSELAPLAKTGGLADDKFGISAPAVKGFSDVSGGGSLGNRQR